MIDAAVSKLATYALRTGLIEECEYTWAINTILDVLKLDSYTDPGQEWGELELAPILDELMDDAHARGVLEQNSVVYRDLFDTELMGRLTPRPAQVIATFQALREKNPVEATDWYYRFSQDTNYIRRDRIAKDMQWKSPTEYGELDITINLSKPEKDPKAIAAARNLPASNYPRCLLCAENEGYAGRVNHPARQNHRVVPITINGSPWFLQYSPYVYYNEHCICFNSIHTPMKIDRACFGKLLDFVGQFPHYFVGSNADLPIVGGSILAHDHFQGGRYTFAMAKASVEIPFTFPGFEDVEAGIVKWPMSVVRIASKDPQRLVELADKVLNAWRGYTDEAAVIYAETDGVPHNTITPIARMREGNFELDLVLRNNLTTPEHPLGLYHPHAQLHHIKKENIGLIEVMGMAILPPRLQRELASVGEKMLAGEDFEDDELTAPHAPWARDVLARHHELAPENAEDILKEEVGIVFSKVLEDCGVFKWDVEGRQALNRFIDALQ